MPEPGVKPDHSLEVEIRKKEGYMHQGLVPNSCRPDIIGQFFMGFDYINQGCSLLGVKGIPH